MKELIELIASILAETKGVIAYADFLEKVPYEQRRHIPNAMREMKRQGVAERKLRFNAESGKTAFTIEAIVPVEEVPVEEGG